MLVLEKLEKLWHSTRERARVETEPASTPVPAWAEPLTETSIFCKLADKYESGEWTWIRGREHDGMYGYCVIGGLRALVAEERGIPRLSQDVLIDPLFQAAERRFKRATKWPSIPEWNDTTGRTAKNVIPALREIGDC